MITLEVLQQKKSIQIAVYGTLRQGCRLDYLMEGAKFVRTTKISNYRMYNTGNFPVIVPSRGFNVIAEIYNIDPFNESFEHTFKMEISVGYVVQQLSSQHKVENNGIYIFVYDSKLLKDNWPPVKNGNWVKK